MISLLSFLLLITTSYTDIKENIIPNKHLLIALIIGIIIGIIYNTIITQIIFGIIALTIFYVFYKIQIFCEGDAKLLTVLTFLNPSMLFIFYIFILSGAFLTIYGIIFKKKHSFFAPFVLIAYIFTLFLPK